jgi:hypothetical protein
MPIPPSPPFDRQQTQTILSAMQQQMEAVDSLVSSGSITLESQGAQSEAEILIVARRNPLDVMIEITHPWGQPLLHIRMNKSRMDVISFSEKRHYQGRLGCPWMLKGVPIPLDLDIIWSLARAYPVLPQYHLARSLKGDQITLLDEQATPLQVVDLNPEGGLPRNVLLCRHDVAISYSDFQEVDGTLYAGKIQLTQEQEMGSLLSLDIRQMICNRPLPEKIFQQEAPPDFEVVPLS